MHMNHMVASCPQTSEGEMELPEIGFTNGCKLFCGSWEPLQEQQTLLTISPTPFCEILIVTDGKEIRQSTKRNIMIHCSRDWDYINLSAGQ